MRILRDNSDTEYGRKYGFSECVFIQIDGEMNRLMIAVAVMTVGDIDADLLNVLVFFIDSILEADREVS